MVGNRCPGLGNLLLICVGPDQQQHHAGEGSVAVAVGVSDMQQVTCDTWHMTFDT